MQDSGSKFISKNLPSQQTSSRLLYAIQVYKQTNATFLVCSGKGDGGLTEAEIMGNIAEQLGVPKQKIIIDGNSRNTREHAEELNKLLDNKNLNIGLVTSAYHMGRSERAFKRYFHNIVSFPSDYLFFYNGLTLYSFIPQADNIDTTAIVLRELVGIAWYKIRGWQ